MHTKGEIQIRSADEDDWPLIWPLMRYVAAQGDSFIYPVDIDEELARNIWLERPPGRTTVAFDASGAFLGTAKMGRNYMGPGSHVSTASFMVEPRQRRRGAARALALDAVEWARNTGFLAMQFNAVVETNLAAISLWQSLGFSIVGTIPAAFRHAAFGFVGLHVMHRALTA